MTTVRVRPNGTVRIPPQRTLRFRFVQVLLILALFLWGIHHFAGVDVPGVPFVDCAEGVSQTAPDGAGGARGVAYDAGRAVRYLSQQPPDPSAIRSSLETASRHAGELVGEFSAAWEGAPPPVEDEPVEGAAPVGACSPCPTAVPVGNGVAVAASAAVAAGWTGEDVVTAVAVAGAESGWRADARNPLTVDGSNAVGMWQTMMPMHAGLYDGGDPTDPAANARVAYKLWKSRGWRPWVAHTNGAYRKHLDEARAAVEAASDTGGTVLPASYQPAARAIPASEPVGGVRPVAQKAADFIRAEFGFTGVIGGRRNDPGSEHHVGLALDIMTSDKALGDRIAGYFAGPGRDSFHVNNVIWRQRITNEGRGWQWGGMEDRGSVTQNHFDHVHVDFHDKPVQAAAPPACGGGGVVAAGLSQQTDGAVFALATFNILGASHTGRGSAMRRLPKAVAALGKHRVDVAGLQEMQRPQAEAFDRSAGGVFARYAPPGDTDNSVIWRRSVFTMVGARLLPVPYFDGRERRMPAVRLRHRATGEVLWVLNVHNPADTRKYPAQGRWRAEALRRELALVDRLEVDGSRVFLVGDMNARDEFASAARRTGLVPVGGGIDWVAGPGKFRGVVSDRTGTRGVSDHPIVVAAVPTRRTF